ncbi:conserved hypothetical protein, secreted [Candidatus Magnetomorum sp. HK-1]|nr:conserved hypothetical protein, secreted [Candidatus Magnetomorum sp. HK-1]
MKKYFLIPGLILSLLVPCVSYAENETVNERLIRVEQSIKSLDKRIDGTNKRIDETNAKIELLRQDMNKQNDLLRQDMNKQNDLLRQDMNKQNELLRQDMNKQNDLLRQDMKARFSESNQRNSERYQDIRSLMYVILGSIFTLIAGISCLIAYIIYDRQTAAKPAREKVEEMEKVQRESLVNIQSIKENMTNLENELKNKIKQIWDRFDQEPPQVLSPA